HGGTWTIESKAGHRQPGAGEAYHDQVEIEIEGQRVSVDEGLAELITGLVSLGHITTASDEEEMGRRDPGIGYISFRDSAGADFFSRLIRDHVEWVVWETNKARPGGETGGVTIRFPSKDIPMITGKV